MNAREGSFPPEIENLVARLLIDKARPLVVCCDRDWRIVDVHGDVTAFGCDGADDGDCATEFEELFLGLPLDEPVDLPFVQLKTGRVAHVSLVPSDAGYTIVFLDAQLEHDRQRVQQQLGNEAALAGQQKTRAIQQLREIRGELEQQRTRLQEANALKNALIATLSHDFRTPLTSIFGYLHLLEQHVDRDDDTQLSLRAIRRNATYLLTLSENLLEYGRSESGAILLNPEGIELQALVDDLDAMFRPLASDLGLAFLIELEDRGEQRPILDETRVRQVLVNLLSNAVRYTARGGVVARLAWHGDVLEVEVRDTGIGIPEEFRERIFVPFNRGVRNGSKGAGLGLSIVKRLVEQMRGELTFTSVTGQGTCFRVVLPTLRRENGDADRVAEGAAWMHSHSALVVDDDPDVAQLLEMLLVDIGFRVRVVHDADTAITEALANPPDVLLVDVELPRLSGNTVVFRLRAQGYRGRIVTLSATPTAEARAAAIAAGTDHYLTKPLNIEQFVRIMRRAVGG
ncbi:hybrid sensor histidine kinase/response regulator [Dokdonella sp. MW10]|uniref:hybrid sensor histidine kinase/response regulator n=1 Tax=Dokdonella sp. MW10 TaxID=2992926 RepID=UPI003F81C744